MLRLRFFAHNLGAMTCTLLTLLLDAARWLVLGLCPEPTLAAENLFLYNTGRPHMSLGLGIPSPPPLSRCVVYRQHRHQLPPDCRVVVEPILSG